MASYTTLLLFVLVNFFTSVITEAQDDPFYLYQECSSDKTNDNTSFQFSLTTLLFSLSSNATGSTQFYHTTDTGTESHDSIYGLFMCRGDVPSHLCQQCVLTATQRLSSQCPLAKEAVMWYEECMVRYSTNPISSTVATKPNFSMRNSGNISNPESFKRLLFSTMNETADEAALPPIGEKKFATKEKTVSGFETLYCLAECTPDLSPQDCRTCLSGVIGILPSCCEGRLGGRTQNPSCNVRYELYPFYLSTVSSQTPYVLATTNTSHTDSEFSEEPVYLSHNCSSNKTFTVNSTYQSHLSTLFSYLSSNATNDKIFHKANVAGTVYGLFMCQGDDIPSAVCRKCVQNATRKISSECGSFQEAIIWYSHCMLRYSYRNFFSKVETSPMYSKLNITSSPNQGQNFLVTLAKTLDKAAIQAGDSNERHGTKSSRLNNKQTLYTLGQCTLDLSIDDCKGCLGLIIGTAIPWYHLGSVGGRVMYPSCNMRFELFPFYRIDDNAPQPSHGKKDDQSRRIIVAVVASTIAFTMLFSFGCYLRRRKGRKSHGTLINENLDQEYVPLESWQFDLTTIKEATSNFADENRIGIGGFGQVYKGSLIDGRQIAVKRLSTSSMQGVNEFKNEILLIAKLQHKNLVTFIGFCLEAHEKILIYEYMLNRSLDYFLFDSQRHKTLSWFQRYNIIRGIARGVVYLHEHSRLKVIHRDLKPSNILLDENMIPKISDFGLARIVEINQDQGSTSRIVGTFGYMSPEYALFGQFSEKSDVFSFGVMILEITTGKKNLSSHESHRIIDGLLSYVWRQWRDETPLNTLDPNIKENYSRAEVIKCIQIGLLCVQQNPDDRPTMTTVLSYLSDHFIQVPTPQEPAFFLHNRKDAQIVVHESSSSQSINTFTPFSVNEMSISEFFPR